MTLKKVVFTGGGTGGHTMPIIAISRELRILSPDLELHYIGPKSDLDFLKTENFKVHSIFAGKVRRYFDWRNFIDIPLKMPLSFLQAFFLLLFIRPNLVFSKGGTGSLPVTYCARLFRIPVFIHESDSYPGLSNRLTSKWAKKVFIAFEKTEYFNQDKVNVVGNPIRRELFDGNRQEAEKELNLTLQKPVVLIWGGSQGSKAINDFILLVLNKMLLDYEIIHVSGKNNYKKVLIETKSFLPDNLEKYYHLYEFLNQVQLKNALLVCDIVISRAGSGSIFEIAAFGKPSILIPLPNSAHNHQSKNAYQYTKSGGGIVIEQESLSPSYFIGEIESVLSKKEKMQQDALKFSRPKAAEKIASEIIDYLSHENQKIRA